MAKSCNEYIKELKEELKKTQIERDIYKSEYNIAIAANKQLAANNAKTCINCQEVAENDIMCIKCHEEIVKRLRLLLFAVVRNSTVAPIGYQLKKTEEEITNKTFETIKDAEKIVDFEKMRKFMNLASEKENRYDN
ncbi:MAG: hypothetical protein IKB70_10110 [Bacilli bacterium]|nr:hypothetical protein [Bacilli bacterium]